VKYLSGQPFSVNNAGNKKYADGWDAIFGPKDEAEEALSEALADAATVDAVRMDLKKIYDEGLPVVAGALVEMGGFRSEDGKIFEPMGSHIANMRDEEWAQSVTAMLNWFFHGAGKSDIRLDVEEFHRTYEIPVAGTPSVPEKALLDKQLRCIFEEAVELLEAAGGSQTDVCTLKDMFEMALKYREHDKVDLVEVADACGDLDYTVESLRLVLGINGLPIADEIQRSNMSKLDENGKPLKREDGKILKGPNFKEPDIRSQLLAQGWEG
jgi:predicted HAD superfamily Cof-like phosphohydrolase